MNVIIFGPPGAGKGTQCKKLVEHYGFYHLSTGDMIRKEISDKTEMGFEVQAIVEAGKFPSSDLINKMVASTILKLKGEKGILFDGYPRTSEQRKFLEKFMLDHEMQIDLALMLDIDEEKLISRIEGRYECVKCGAVYSKGLQPKKQGVCDVCGEDEFKRRADDSAEILKTRLKTYHQETEEIVKYYDQQSFLTHINGDQPIEAVQADIEAVIDEKLIKTDKRSANMVDL